MPVTVLESANFAMSQAMSGVAPSIVHTLNGTKLATQCVYSNDNAVRFPSQK